jgi:hypothetical protein
MDQVPSQIEEEERNLQVQTDQVQMDQVLMKKIKNLRGKNPNLLNQLLTKP